jgi:ABC-2 type transport system ATP-binding protein
VTAIAFEQVSKRFGRNVLALDGATWSIGQGARACLLGPNGAGKSTCIRLLQGALQPTSGSVTLLGAAVGSHTYWDVRRRTGIVPQGPGMYQDLTTAEFLELARRLFGRGDVEDTIEAFGLGEHRHKMLAQLSGGYQRRLALAAALLTKPELLLLDEPTVGLDPVAAREVREILRRVMAGRTTLLCTHNLAEAEALCDEVVILRAGRVLLHERLTDLRRRATPHLRLAALQGADVLARALRQRELEPSVQDGRVLVAVADPQSEAAPLLRGLLSEGLDIYECSPVQATLEDLFLSAVKGEPENP